MSTRLDTTAYTGRTAGPFGSKIFVSAVEPYRNGSRQGPHCAVCFARQHALSVKIHTGRPTTQSSLKISAVATIDHSSSQSLTPRIPNASQIFDSQHVPHVSPSLLLYFPLVLQKILGLDIVWKNADSIPAERHVLVSNHVTAGDLMVLYSLPQHYVHLISAQLPKRISQAKHHRVRLWHATKDVYESLAKTPEHSESIHLFPEGGMTNGAGMVRFSRGFMRFGKALPIVPVALKVSVPWGIRTHTLTSNFVANLFWFCFVPQIQLEATVLKPVTLQEGQGNGAFVESVQQAIADQLEVGIADITFQEKKKLIRQYSRGKH